MLLNYFCLLNLIFERQTFNWANLANYLREKLSFEKLKKYAISNKGSITDSYLKR